MLHNAILNFMIYCERIRVMTGEDWNKLLHDVSISWPHCTPGKRSIWSGDCGNYTYSLIYFSSFYIIITYITLNLLVAIIIEQFSLFYSTNEEDLISHEDIVHLQETFNLVNKKRKEKISLMQFKFFIRFFLDMNKHNFLFKCIVFEAGKYHNENGITFQGILQVISYRYVDSKRFLEPDEFVEREDLEYSIIEEVAKQTIQKWLSNCISSIKRRREIEEQDKCMIPKIRFKSPKMRRVSNVHFERRNTLQVSSLNYQNYEIIITDESSVESKDSEESFDEIKKQTNSGEFLYASMIRSSIDEVHDLFNDEVDQYHFC